MTGRGIVREHQPVYADGRQIGDTTSGTHCPWVGQAVALALVDAAYKEPGTPLQVDVRGRRVDAQVVQTAVLPAGIRVKPSHAVCHPFSKGAPFY